MRHGPSTPPTLLESLNATPMMDVMLVLLVVFMVVTPLIHSGPDLVLPSGRHGEPEPEEVLAVRLTRNNELWSETGALSEADLVAVLRRKPDITLLIEADRRLPYHRVRDLLALAGAAGLRQVLLVAQRSGPE